MVAYDGTDFCGFQKQEPVASWAIEKGVVSEGGGGEKTAAKEHPKDLPPSMLRKSFEMLEDRPGRIAMRTVQHVLERAVREVVRQPVELVGASRTDSGVHAKGQVAAFTCGGEGGAAGGWPVERGLDRLVMAINGKLPEDCLVRSAEEVEPTFNPIGGCIGKGYSYTIHTGVERPLFDRRYVHHVREGLDWEAMDAAARLLEGEHDFASFAAAGHGRLTTVRRIDRCRVARTEEGRIRIEVSGNGFLYNMVRIIAGTLAEVGRGHRSVSSMGEVIGACDRQAAGPTFPPTGLCLEWIAYPPTPPRDQWGVASVERAGRAENADGGASNPG